ncbi:hypothetical protein B0H13DRAFT_2413592 [Mycena leptocephala]|nr:hypothetical protein B0H13DRAFT_2413592 [Mycena leptocephala]
MRLALSSLGGTPASAASGRLGAPRDPPQSIVKDRGFIGKSSEISLVNAAINLKVDLKREQHSHCQSPEQSADDHVEVDSAVPAWPSWRLEYWRWKSWATVERRTALFYAPKYIPPVAASANVRAWSRGRPAFESWSCVRLGHGGAWIPGRLPQVPQVERHLFGQTKLYDLQYCCLAVTFLAGSSSPQACRMLVGIGLRLEQTAGIHQRTVRIEVPSVERELLKRAFWVLVWLDCSISSGLRHPYALQYDDFDVELPLECDDEFWEHPIHPFQQPPGLPSRIASFNMMIRHYIVQSQDTVWAPQGPRFPDGRSKRLRGARRGGFRLRLKHLASQIPEHLRWDPRRADPVFFDQSVALYCRYYHLQILIHRQFIPVVQIDFVEMSAIEKWS